VNNAERYRRSDHLSLEIGGHCIIKMALKLARTGLLKFIPIAGQRE
jgi:hypothetical protein